MDTGKEKPQQPPPADVKQPKEAQSVGPAPSVTSTPKPETEQQQAKQPEIDKSDKKAPTGDAYDDEINRLLNELSGEPNK